MKKRLLALICALALLMMSCTAQAAKSQENYDEDKYWKVENEIDLIPIERMEKFAGADPVTESFPLTVRVGDGEIYIYTEAYKLYVSSTEDPTPSLVCPLTQMPEKWTDPDARDDMTEEELEQLKNVVVNIAIYKGAAYGFCPYSGRFGRIDEQGVHWNEVTLDVSQLRSGDSEYEMRTIRNGFISKDGAYYYCLVKDPGYESSSLFRFDLATGECRKYETERMLTVYPYKDGDFIVLRLDDEGAYVVSQLAVESGEVTDLDYDLSLFEHESMQMAGGLAYDSWGWKDAIVVASDGLIYRIFPGQEPLVCDNCEGAVDEDSPVTLVGATNYYVYCGGELNWYNLHEYGHESALTEVGQVTVAGGFPFWYEAEQALKEHCGDLVVHEAESVSAEELADMLNTQDDSVDIFLLNADSTYYSLMKKGLCADLSSSLALVEDVESMYQPIQQAVINERGQLTAYPAELRVWRFGVNEGYWNQVFPDRPLPTTFSEVMDAWIEWEESWAEEYRGVGFFMGEFDYENCVKLFINLYVQQHADEELPDLNAPALKEVLEKLQKVYEIRKAAGRSTSWDVPDELLADTGETGPGIVFWYDMQDATREDSGISPDYDSEYIHGVLKGDRTYLPITFEQDDEPRTTAQMSVYVVNPYSKNLAGAIQVLECLSRREVNPYLFYAAHPQQNEPYENLSFEAELSRYTEQVKLYTASIEKAQAEGKDVSRLQVQLDYYNELIANQEREKWVVTQETIDTYRAAVEKYPLEINMQSPYSRSDGGLSEVIAQMSSRLAEGQITLDEALKTIAERAEMMYLEDR